MVNQPDVLDGVFGALSHAARRHTLELLASGPRTASELAAPHGMTLGGFMKHLRVLADAGLIVCAKEGRTVTCHLADAPLSAAAGWLAGRRPALDAQLDALGRHLYHREQIGAHRAAEAAAPPTPPKKRSRR